MSRSSKGTWQLEQTEQLGPLKLVCSVCVLHSCENPGGHNVVTSTNSVRCDIMQVRYHQLGIGDPTFTYGVIFLPQMAPAPRYKLTPDKGLQGGCYHYQVG